MKNKMLKALVIVLSLMLILVAFAGCNQAGIQGPAGPQGEQGVPGINGENGIDGKSAYDLAVEKGYNGTVEEWLASLVGEAGVAGENGANGQSAYEIAVKNGYTGTEIEWLASLVGAAGTNGNNGSNGKSAYELACENGFTGSLSEWLDSLVGKDGADGTDGTNGKSAYELACENGFNGTLTEWLASLVGKDGSEAEKGEDGEDGKSAYELAVENGFKGDLQTWLASLVGSNGENGKSAYDIAVDNGYKGTEKEWLATLVGAKGEPGADGIGIQSITLLTTNKNIDTYQILYTNGETTTFTVTNGVNGANGNDGVGINNAVINAEGELVLSLSNGKSLNLGTVVGSKGDNGKDGKDGVGIANVALNGNNLVITLTNGTVIDLGNIKGADGKDGVDGVSVIKSEINAKGELVLYYSNNTSTNLGKVVGSNGTNGSNGSNGTDGKDGVGIQNVTINDDGNLIVTLTSGTVLDLGNIKGPQGDKGDNGIDGVSVVDAEINNDGELIFTLSNDEKINVGKIIGSNGINGSNGTNGVDGVGIKGIAFNANGELIITLTDNGTINCGKVPACSHSYSSWNTVSEANCTSMGVKVRTCSKCGFEDYDFVSSLGHNYKNTVVSATCTEQGYTLHECSKCDYEYRDTYTAKATHSYGAWSEMLSNCTTKVLCQSCAVCGSSAIKSESGSWHNYTTSVIAPTCSEQGYTLHSCTNCGNSYKDTYTEKTEHSYVELSVLVSTCTERKIFETCTICNSGRIKDVEPIISHNIVNNKCTSCSYEIIEWDGTVSNGIAKGNGTEANPYIIETPQELAFLSAKVLAGDTAYASAYYIQANDFDMMGLEWTPIGNKEKDLYDEIIGTPFSGNYNGNNHFIKNVLISQQTLSKNNSFGWKSYAGGFFGGLANATVKNLEIIDMNINIIYTDRYNLSIQYGSFAGKVQKSKIENCRVTGNMVIESKTSTPADFYVGGFVGFSDSSTITSSNAEVNITMDVISKHGRDVGGFIGQNGFNNQIVNCSSGNNIIKLSYSKAFGIVCGGFAGNNSEVIRNSYVYNSSIIANIMDSSYDDSDGINIVSIGGFCGQNGLVSLKYPTQGDAGGDIYNCYTDCNVDVTTNLDHVYVGGFIGANKLWEGTTITNCVSVGSVNLTSSCSDTAMGCFAGLFDTSNNTNYAISDNQYVLNGTVVSYNSNSINKTDVYCNYITLKEVTTEFLYEILGYVMTNK